MASFMRKGTEHLWAAGTGILVVGYIAKGMVWNAVHDNLTESLAVEQKKNVADYGESLG